MTDTPQLAFWRGAFGDSYIARNDVSEERIRERVPLWSEILGHTLAAPPRSILEIGPNVGLNLRTLRFLTGAELLAVEPNERAREVLLADAVVAKKNLRAGAASSIDFPDAAAELCFTSGVLIHIHPDDLLASCREIHRCSGRWIACIEYFSDKPETVPYRGHDDVLFKCDFGAFWLDHFPDLAVTAYGFAWKRVSGLDNVTWWLFEKR